MQEIELFNLKDDIGEQHDLSKLLPDKATALREQLHSWRQAVGAVMPTPNPDYTPAKVRRVGIFGKSRLPSSYVDVESFTDDDD